METQTSTELEKKVRDFLEHLEVERDVSPLTVRNYTHYLNKFLIWVKPLGVTGVSQIGQDVVRQYRLYLSRLLISKKTQGYYAISLRSFLKWLLKTDHKTLSPEKIDLPKSETHSLKFLNQEQVERLLNSPTHSTIVGVRDRAILEVLYSTGLRVSELTSLNRDQIDLTRREFGIIGKGRRSRVVFLSESASNYISQYFKDRNDNYKPMFIRHKGSFGPEISDEEVRLTARSIQRLIKMYARKVKIPVDVTPHVLRHSFATDLLINGADLRSVQEMLGHKNVSTTQIYTHITNKQLREVHDAFHARRRA